MDESNLNAPQDARKSILDPTALNIRVEDYTNPLSFNTPKPPSSRMGSQHTQRIFTTKGKVVFGMEVKRDKLVTTSPKSAGSCEMSQNSYLPCSSFLRSPTNSKRSATPVLSNLFFEYKNKQFDADLKKKKQTQQSVEMYKQLQQAGGQQAWKEQVRKSREVEIIYDEEKEEKSKELRTTLLQSPDKQIESSKPNMRQIKVQMFKNLEEQKTITFTSKTPIKLVYTPIAPEKWILDGKEPTREFISTNFELYGDIGLFLTYREKWYKTNILNELPYYAKVKEVTVLACTWNVNQCVYPREKIDRWTSGIKYSPDVILIGMQELEMSFDAIITGSRFSEKSVEYSKLLLASINRTNTQYIPLGYYQLCGVVIYVFHNERLKDKISDVGFGDCRVGAMSGTLANKGGVAYRMKIYDSTVCFVVSHLAAHQHFLERRYQDWTEISKMKITYLDTQTSQPKKVGLLDHDVVVWMGDLNFRIDLSDGDVRKLLRTKNYIELAKKDQLLTAMKKKIIFQKFNEASLTFAPTFKVKIGEEDCVYEENRIPSWCDRVLWKCENGHYVQSMSYMSHEIYTSDHKPVSSILSLNLQEIDHNKKTEVLTYLEKVAMKYEETTRPNVHVENDEILFEGVELFATYTKTVTLKNCGKFGVSYEFEETEDCIYTHDWLTIKQCEGFIDILEGRDSIKIPLTVCITEEIAWMSQDRNFMTQELWVRLGDGKERIKFTVRVRSRVSLIGMRLETLNRLAKPLIGNSKMVMKKIPFQVPKEIYRLVDWIYKKYSVGCFERGETKYTKEEMKSLVDVLSLNAEFQSERVGLCCECLLFFLANLHDAIVSIECGIIDNDMLLMQKIKFQTPDEQRILFLYILCFCKKLIELGEKLETISSRFTKALFRDADQVTLKKLKKFIERLLIGKDQFSLSIYQN